MIPPDFAPAPGLPDQKRTIAAIREALEQANPGNAVFLSSIGSEQPSGLGLITSTHLMEEAMRTLPIPVAYLRAGSFMENWLGALDHIRTTGEMPFFYAPLDRKFPLVATQDIGLAAATVLQESWTGERVLEVDGPKGGTDLLETAAAFGRALGRAVKAVQLPEVAWQTVLEGMGMPADRTGLYIEMVKSFNSGWIHFGNAGTETFHGQTTIEAFAQVLVKTRRVVAGDFGVEILLTRLNRGVRGTRRRSSPISPSNRQLGPQLLRRHVLCVPVRPIGAGLAVALLVLAVGGCCAPHCAGQIVS